MIRFAAILCVVLGAFPATAQVKCIVDDPIKNAEEGQLDATMRVLMLAHAPIEYRHSCGLRSDDDTRFFEAIRASVGCEASDNYNGFFGQYLNPSLEYLFAVRRVDLRSDENFATYCQIVERIDLKNSVNADGSINRDILHSQTPLFQALQAHVAKYRWQQ